jgi:5-methylcytosine-specific restriction protein A
MPNSVRYGESPLAGLRTDADASKRERDGFYSGARWKALRDRFRAKHPTCQRCEARGEVAETAVVHHVVDRLISPSMAYSWTNLESLCHECHNREHARRKGGA